MSEQDPVSDFLAHYGVKGMRWGVRKPRGDHDETFRERYKESKKFDYQKQLKDKKKELNSQKISNDEIRKARSNIEAKRAAFQKAVDDFEQDPTNPKLVRAMVKADEAWAMDDDRYTAHRKTTGEKFVAALLAGPIGARRASDAQTTRRANAEKPVKYKRP